ncbi:2-oxo acid dehydrogenase subunit E2 [Psychromonas aquimarina]|uniref:2-oxo acid dehydrogenase subunit E2 n=1 Tax=Psychromonas aquimarina TaxID=444919 RepID=UPI0003F7AC05|nr:2-oxo acid dehydrogenase subunit E2 [Psychromonas aquimarina]
MSDSVHDLNMPSFGADMAQGTLVQWLVKQGDSIKRGSVIAVIDTHKGAIDLDLFEDAVIEQLLVSEGQKVKVGTAIARLRSLSGTPPQAAVPAQSSTAPDTAPLSKQTDKRVTADGTDFIPATPAARAFAAQHQLTLSNLATEKGNEVITLADAQKALTKLPDAAPSQAPEAEEKIPPKQSGFDKQAMRLAISDTVTRSKQEIPHYYLNHRLDITALEQYLQTHNAAQPVESRLLLAAPLLCAAARTLMNNKQLNGLYQEQQFFPGDTVNLANAINLRGGGLVMPVIRDAQNLTAQSMMQILKEQVSRARSGSLLVSELTQSSCTVTSIGERGAEQMSAVIYPPQVAVIALGSPHKQALVVNGSIKIRTVIIAGLAADHRVSDGHIGARFLYQLNQQLQKPEELWTVSN